MIFALVQRFVNFCNSLIFSVSKKIFPQKKDGRNPDRGQNYKECGIFSDYGIEQIMFEIFRKMF